MTDTTTEIAPADLGEVDLRTVKAIAARMREIGASWSSRIIEIDAGLGRFEPDDSSDRARRIASMRDLADLLEANPDLPIGTSFYLRHSVYDGECGMDAKTRMRQIRRMYGGTFEKSWDNHETLPEFFLRGRFGEYDVQIATRRENVCERVVTATVEETVEEIDPAYLEQAPKIERVVTKEVVDWICPEDLT
jgi:hypothetical protein